MDWARVTAAWVREGLVTDAQREPLLRWLQTHASPEGWVVERVWPALVAVASWMLAGSASVALEGLLSPSVAAAGFAATGAGQVALGAVAHRAGQDALGAGFASAGLVVFAVAVAGRSPDPTLALVAGAGIAGVAAAVAAGLRSRGVALAGTIGSGWVGFGWLDAAVPASEAAVVVLAALGACGAGAAVLRRSPALAPADTVALLPTLAALRAAWETVAGGSWPALAAASSAAALGATLLGLGAWGRSAGLLASGVLAFVFAEAYLLDGVVDRRVAAAALAAEGGILLAAAVAVGLWRAGRRLRPVDPEER